MFVRNAIKLSYLSVWVGLSLLSGEMPKAERVIRFTRCFACYFLNIEELRRTLLGSTQLSALRALAQSLERNALVNGLVRKGKVHQLVREAPALCDNRGEAGAAPCD